MRRFEGTSLPVVLMSVALTVALLLASRAYASGDDTWWRAADYRYRVAVSGGLGYSVPGWEWFDGFTGGPSVDVSAKCAVGRKTFVGVMGCRQGLGVEPRLTRPVQIGVDPDGVPVYADVARHVALNEFYGLYGGKSRPAGDRRPFVSYEIGLGAIRQEVRATLRHAGAQVTEVTHETRVAFLFGVGCTVPVGRRLGLETAGTVRLIGDRSADNADVRTGGVLYGVRLGLVLLLGGALDVASAQVRGLGDALQAVGDEATSLSRVDLFAPSTVGGTGGYPLAITGPATDTSGLALGAALADAAARGHAGDAEHSSVLESGDAARVSRGGSCSEPCDGWPRVTKHGDSGGEHRPRQASDGRALSPRPRSRCAGGLLAPDRPDDARTALEAVRVQSSGIVEIHYAVGRSEAIDVAVCDVRGRRLRGLATGLVGPGRYGCVWDGRDDRGVRTGRGVYFVVLQTQGGRLTRARSCGCTPRDGVDLQAGVLARRRGVHAWEAESHETRCVLQSRWRRARTRCRR